MNETTLRYSEPLLREAVRAFFFRAVIRGLRIRFYAACGFVAACLIYFVAQGDRGWAVGFMAATLVFAGVAIFAIYRAHSRNTIGRFRKMRVPEATLSCTEENFTLKSELGSATLPWSAVTEVWRYPRFWLLVYSRSQFSTLPLDCLDAEMQAFITSIPDGHAVRSHTES